MGEAIAAEELTIVVVSSQTSQKLIVKRFMEMRKHQVNIASSGQEMIEQDKAFACGLMIIDNTLTDMPIEEALFTCRENRRLMKDVANIEYCPVIILAAASEKLDEIQLRKLGAVSRLNKPLNLKELGKVVSRVQNGDFDIKQDEKINLGILDPEIRAVQFFTKLLTADDLNIVNIKDPIELSASLQDQSLHVLIMETIGLNTSDIPQYVKSICDQQPKLKLMICTAYNDKDEHQKMIQAGAKHVITKPIDPPQLRSLVRQMVSEISL